MGHARDELLPSTPFSAHDVWLFIDENCKILYSLMFHGVDQARRNYKSLSSETLRCSDTDGK
jgi:hypothetical protein